MEPEIKDALPESSTGAGENTSTASPAAEQHEEPKDLRAHLEKRFDEVKRAKEKPADDGKPAAPADGDKKASDAKAQGDKADNKAKGDDGKMVPLSALKSRVGKEVEKRKATQEKLDASEIENRRLRAALDITGDELKREREARAKKLAIDPKDEQIRGFELSKRAEEAAAKIDAEHKAAREQAQHEEAVADIRGQLEAEIKEAVGDESVVTAAEIIAELRKPQNINRAPAEIAKEKIAVREEAFKKRFARPAFPSTAKGKAGGSHSLRVEPTLDFMQQRLAQLRQMQPVTG